MKINKGECPLKPTQLTPSKKKQVLIYYISLFILIGIAFSLILFYKHQQTLTITNGIVNMREGPGITYNMKEQLKEGTHYQVLDEQNHWKKIIANEGQVGWIPDWLTTDGVLSSNSNMQNSGFIATVINNQATVHEEAQASSKEIGKASQGKNSTSFTKKGDGSISNFGTILVGCLKINSKLPQGLSRKLLDVNKPKKNKKQVRNFFLNMMPL